MKKIVILIISIVIVLVTIIGYNIHIYNKTREQAIQQNKVYEQFYNVEVLGTDIASLINKIEDANKKNNVEKDEKGMYISNNSNSINLEVKFMELEDPISFEKIEKQGINQFVQNFGAMSFKCTNIEYHQATGYIKYMYFEQTK